MSVAHDSAPFAAADCADFDSVYRLFWPRLMKHVLRVYGRRDAEEITQETFARGLHALDLSRSDAEIWVWLKQVARNVAIDVSRRRQHCDATGESAEVLELRASHLPEPAALAAEKARMLRAELSGLSELQRSMVLLHEVEGRTLHEIAEILELSEACVRKSLQRVRRHLAVRLQVLRGPAAVLAPLTLLQRLLDRARPARGASLAASLAGVAVFGTLGFAGVPGMGAEQSVRQPSVATASSQTMTPKSVDGTAGQADFARPRTGAQSPTGAGSSRLLSVPSTPLSPGRHHSVGVRVPTPAGTVRVSADLGTDPRGGVVCNSPIADCH